MFLLRVCLSVNVFIVSLRELVLTTIIMAPAPVEPWLGPPKNVLFPDVSLLSHPVPGSSFESTETKVHQLMGGKMTSDFNIILIIMTELT